MFNVLFIYLVDMLLPTRLRQSRMVSYVKLLVSYIEKIYDNYIAFRAVKLYDINFTGQIMYLQKKLRDVFGCQGITIEDGLLSLPFYLSNQIEQDLPIYIGNNFINEHEYSVGESIVYLGKWYHYINTGTGATPDLEDETVVTVGGDYEFYLSNQQELSSQNDFVVKIPQACYVDMTADDFHKMRVIIEYYKLANKTYTIIPY